MDIKEFLQENITDFTKTESGDKCYIPPATYAEFATGGKLDYARITTKYEIYCCYGEFIAAVEAIFGTIFFYTDEDAKSDITKEEFLDMYSFGLFPSVRDWQVAVFRQKNKFISLNDLFTWVLEAKNV